MTVPDPMDAAVSFIQGTETTPVAAPTEAVGADAPAEAVTTDPTEVSGSDTEHGPGAGAGLPEGGAVVLAPDPTRPSADFRMAVVASVTLDLPSQHPQVCLRELESPRRQLTFSIGMPDAVALAHAQRRIATPRPLTHELMGDVLRRFDIDIVAVRIVGRVGTVHFAELDLRGRSGRSVHSCRPTDALILALHQPVQVPILIDARLLESGADVPPPGTD